VSRGGSLFIASVLRLTEDAIEAPIKQIASSKDIAGKGTGIKADDLGQ
jgi:hypothetical protein